MNLNSLCVADLSMNEKWSVSGVLTGVESTMGWIIVVHATLFPEMAHFLWSHFGVHCCAMI